jgi:hypothetical protein
MTREIHTFPSRDTAFRDAAWAALKGVQYVAADGVAAELAERMRPVYPAVSVHRQHPEARIRAGDLWYVYRDGR